MFKTVPFFELQRTSTTDATMYPALNTAKALLIIMVVIAHCLPAGMIQYYNYFFEMPLFLSISGFLVKESAFIYGLGRYLVRVTKRLVIPWVIAVIIYLPLQLHGRSLSEYSLVNIIYPFFHLWFVPAYVLGGVTSYFIIRNKWSAKLVLAACAIITCIWYIYFRDNPNINLHQTLFFLGDKRMYAYLFFFLTGFCLRNNLITLKMQPFALLVCIVVSFTLVAFCVQNDRSNFLLVLPYLCFNYCLAAFVLVYLAPLNVVNSSWLQFINTQSLGLYLYHPIIMMGIYYIVGDPDKTYITMLQGFVVALVTLALTILLVKMVRTHKLAGRFMLGNIFE